MFSQGEPVLAGVDLDSGYLFGLVGETMIGQSRHRLPVFAGSAPAGAGSGQAQALV